MSETRFEILVRLRASIMESHLDGITAAPESGGYASKFIEVFPFDIFPCPDFGVDPQGAVSFDWMLEQRRVFSMSFEPGSKLACAWLDGSESGHFWEPFDGMTIPEKVTECMKRLYRY